MSPERPSPVPTPADPGYTVSGPLGAPTLVFVHGTRLTRAAWGPQVAGLSDTYRTIAVDLPGHGTLADREFTLDAAADHLAAAIDEAATDRRAIVVGLSLGGYVAMELAARSPERVRGLVLAGATAEPTGPKMLPYLALARVMGSVDGARLDVVNRWFFRRRFPAAIADPIVDGGFWSLGGASALRAVAGHRFLPLLEAYEGPTLIINGELDLPFRLFSKSFARSAHGAHRVRLAGATHLSNLDRPAAFNEAIRRFERSIDHGS
jgi:pimeloyl-ACP methyl ester carboxylesterase